MNYKRITPYIIGLSIYFSLISSVTYARKPFEERSISISSSVSDDIKEDTVVFTDPTDSEEQKGESEFPCEGTINCQYGQYCRTSPWGDILTILEPGSKVKITGKEGDWYTINYNGQKCYLHYSLVDTPTTPAYDGYHPYAYADVNPNYKKENKTKIVSSNKQNSTKETQTTNKKQNKNVVKNNTKKNNSNNNNNKNKKIDTTKDINGPEVPECLLKGLEVAKKSQWNVSNKCLQFSGTIAEAAGANVPKGQVSYQPQSAWEKTKDTSLRGHKIMDLKQAALDGKLLPGMLIHVKHDYDKDPAYHKPDNGHHWFMYMGMVNGEPMFVDNIKDNKLRNTETQAQTFNVSKNYGERRITAIYDPFADQR